MRDRAAAIAECRALMRAHAITADELRCKPCGKTTTAECSHVDCPNRRRPMHDPVDDRGYDQCWGGFVRRPALAED